MASNIPQIPITAVESAITTAYNLNPKVARQIVVGNRTNRWLTDVPSMIEMDMDEIVVFEDYTEMTQSFQVPFTKKGDGIYDAMKFKMRGFKVDQEIIPANFKNTILHKWTADNKNAENTDFAAFWFSDLGNKLQSEEITRYMMFGEYIAPTVNVANAAKNTVDGFNKVLKNLDSDANNPFKFLALGSYNLSDVYDYINDFISAAHSFRIELNDANFTEANGNQRQLLLPPVVFDAYKQQRAAKSLSIDMANLNALDNIFWDRGIQFVSDITFGGVDGSGRRIIYQVKGDGLTRWYNTMNEDRSFIMFGKSENARILPYTVQWGRAYGILNPFRVIANDFDNQTP